VPSVRCLSIRCNGDALEGIAVARKCLDAGGGRLASYIFGTTSPNRRKTVIARTCISSPGNLGSTPAGAIGALQLSLAYHEPKAARPQR
jgi:hypothetical protein